MLRRPATLREVRVRTHRGWRAGLAAATMLVATAPAFAGGFLDWLFHHDVQVITSTDATPAGALLRAASPSHPVYYVALSVGYHDFGAAIAGDKLPAPQDMNRTIVRVLAKQGFLPADAQHRASQLIIFAWGTLYPNIVPDPWNPNLPGTQLNLSQTLGFLGGDKLGLVPEHPEDERDTLFPGLTRFNSDAQAIASVAGDDLYVAALASYEFPMAQPKHPKLLWRSKISCPARGLVMADTLPTMLVIAGPNIGHATASPVWVNASDKFKPDVRIGNPKVEEYLDSVEPPVDGNQDAPPKGGRTGK
jgi:hypothetical protein